MINTHRRVIRADTGECAHPVTAGNNFMHPQYLQSQLCTNEGLTNLVPQRMQINKNVDIHGKLKIFGQRTPSPHPPLDAIDVSPRPHPRNEVLSMHLLRSFCEDESLLYSNHEE